MNISIFTCLSELVKEKFGGDKWNEILKLSDMETSQKYMRSMHGLDMDDKKVFELVGNTCKVLGITAQQAADAFGEYWVCVYAPKNYRVYFSKFTNAREFIMGMDHVHAEVTKRIANSNPPRFDIEELDHNRIKVHYKSTRGMIDFYIGLAKGIGKYFNTPLEVKKLDEEYVEIQF